MLLNGKQKPISWVDTIKEPLRVGGFRGIVWDYDDEMAAIGTQQYHNALVSLKVMHSSTYWPRYYLLGMVSEHHAPAW